MPKLVSSVTAVPSDRRSPRHRRAVLLAGVMAAVAAALPAQVPPGLQFAELGKRHLPPDADPTQSVVHGDVDGDGDLDLVIGNNSQQQNRLYLNNGASTFTDATATHMPVDSDNTRSMALGDVDGDGDLDLVLGNVGQQNRLYLNSGTGAFTDATASRMPVDSDATYAVAFGDVDGDGDLDLVLGNASLQQDRLYLNNGTGTFADATAGRIPVVSDSTYSVVLGDVDGDGDLDLVFGNSGQQNRLCLNNGTGTFTDATASRMPVDSDATTSVALGDVDGDGDLDLVIGNYVGQQNRLYRNSGTGAFTDATAGGMPVDGDATTSVALGDVDGDGDLDLAFGNVGQNRLYRNSGTGTFTDATASRMPEDSDNTRSVVAGDVDGDGDLDLVIGNGQQQNRLYLNDGNATFSDTTSSRLPSVVDSTTSMALGDVDGDGDLDLVIGNGFPGSQNRLGRNDGRGTFSDATASSMPVDGDHTNAVALGDVDGDGDLDLVVGNHGDPPFFGQQDRLYVNNGTGKFLDATTSRMPVDFDFANSLALGDVDGDGDLDLVIGNDYGQNRLYRNNGAGTFTDATAGRMPVDSDRTHAVALGDVDGDGDLDLVIGNYWQQNRLCLNNGTGTFTDASAGRMPVDSDATTSVALGDVDGDGDPDLVFGNSGQQNRLCLNNGIGTFTDATASRMPVDSDSTNSVALGDVDGDGDLDLVFGNYFGQRSRLYLNNGSGAFTDATASRMPMAIDQNRSVTLVDVDSDGDLDMLTGSPWQDRLYTNLQRQLDAPYLLRSGRIFTLDVYCRYGPPSQFDVAVPFLSTTRLGIPVPPHGILGIDPMVSLPPVVIPPLTGTGTVTWLVPSSPAFAGIEIFAQAAILHVPLELRLSNVTADVLIR